MAGKFQDADAFVKSMLGNLEAYHNDPEGFEARMDQADEDRWKRIVENRHKTPGFHVPVAVIKKFGGEPTPEELQFEESLISDVATASAEPPAEAPKS